MRFLLKLYLRWKLKRLEKIQNREVDTLVSLRRTRTVAWLQMMHRRSKAGWGTYRRIVVTLDKKIEAQQDALKEATKKLEEVEKQYLNS